MKARVLSVALDEIVQAARWFDAQRPGLGAEFWNSVDATLRDIESNPLAFAVSEFATQKIDLRTALVGRFKIRGPLRD